MAVETPLPDDALGSQSAFRAAVSKHFAGALERLTMHVTQEVERELCQVQQGLTNDYARLLESVLQDHDKEIAQLRDENAQLRTDVEAAREVKEDVLVQVEAARKKVAEGEASRTAEMEAAIRRAAELEVMKKQAAEEEAARKKASDLEAKKAAEEELAKKQAAEEEIARKKAAEEEVARKRAAEEEVARKRAAEEEVARKKAAEEEIARKKAAEEEVARKRAAEEEIARKKAAEEEVARKRAAEEEIARTKFAEQEVARKKAAEEEAARKRAAEEEQSREAQRSRDAEEEMLEARLRRSEAEAAAQKRAGCARTLPNGDMRPGAWPVKVEEAAATTKGGQSSQPNRNPSEEGAAGGSARELREDSPPFAGAQADGKPEALEEAPRVVEERFPNEVAAAEDERKLPNEATRYLLQPSQDAFDKARQGEKLEQAKEWQSTLQPEDSNTALHDWPASPRPKVEISIDTACGDSEQAGTRNGLSQAFLHDVTKPAKSPMTGSLKSETWMKHERVEYVQNLNLANGPNDGPVLHFLEEAFAGTPLPKPWKIVRAESGGRTFFVNTSTGATSWSHPLEDTLRELAAICRVYMTLPTNQKHSWLKTLKSAWSKEAANEFQRWHQVDYEGGRKYYFNKDTRETMWDHPVEVVLPGHYMKIQAIDKLSEMHDGCEAMRKKRPARQAPPLPGFRSASDSGFESSDSLTRPMPVETLCEKGLASRPQQQQGAWAAAPSAQPAYQASSHDEPAVLIELLEAMQRPRPAEPEARDHREAGGLESATARSEVDTPGCFIIDYDQIPVSEHYSRRSAMLHMLRRGAIVQVVEVSAQLDEGRLRARLKEPIQGWISIRFPARNEIYAHPASPVCIDSSEGP